jgi:hypothetical protein
MPRIHEEKPQPEQAREEAQRMLGQIHGVMWLASEELSRLLPETADEGPQLTASELEDAEYEAHAHFGKVQAALNSGQCDKALVEAGFAGAQGKAKRKGFWAAISQFYKSKKQAAADYLSRHSNVLSWSSSVLGSLGSALEKEIEKVPGASAAAEAAKEFIELLQNMGETATAKEPPTSRNAAYRDSAG